MKLIKGKVKAEVTGSSVAHDAPSTANPILGGFVAEATTPAAVADGDMSQAAGTLYGAAFANLRRSDGTELNTGATGDAGSGGSTLGAANYGYNGATWDRIRTVNTGQLVVTPRGPAGSEVIAATGAAVPAGAILIAQHDSAASMLRSFRTPNTDAKTQDEVQSCGGMGFNGATWDRLRTVNTGQLVVTPKNVAGQEQYLTTAADSKVLSSVYNATVLAQMMGFNNTNADQWRNNTEGTLLVSAARTAATASATQTNYNARGVLVSLNVTAASGAGGLQVQIWSVDPVGSGQFKLNATPTAILATGRYVYELYPGSSTAAVVGGSEINQRTSAILPRVWFVQVVHGDGSSYTYSVGYQLVI